MNSKHGSDTRVPSGATYVASTYEQVYYEVGHRGWHGLPPASLLWFPTEQAARDAGYRSWASAFEGLEDFEILEELGRGGSSVVLHARDRGLGREVAIKLIRAWHQHDPEALARFTREAQLVARLQHPNIVSVFALKQLPGGGFALVMEYVPGRTLRDLIRNEAPLSPGRVERILQDVGEALSVAHHAGVVHRDVKPDNIFIHENGGRALLADFGIAIPLDDATRITRTGATIGTPTYMAPEQFDGHGVDGRCDLYSLGLVGWEMLTGRTPWQGESLYNVIYKQRTERLPPLRKLRPDVPLRISLAIEGALHKNPEGRWSSVDAFLSHLSDASLAARWGWWSAALAWKRAASRRISGSPARVASSERQDLSTVRFPRPASPAGDPVPYPPPRGPFWRRIRPTVAAAGILLLAAVGIIAATVGLRQRVIASNADAPPSTPSAHPRGVVLADHAASPAHDGDSEAETVAASVASVDSTGASGPERAQLEPQAGAAAEGTGTSAVRHGGPMSVPSSAAGTDGASGAAAIAAAPTERFLAVDRSRSPIAVGGMHTCAIGARGLLFCWGGNDRGQLGVGDGQRQLFPVQVSVDRAFASVVAGGFHTCALSPAGAAYCWGENQQGQLGDGTRTASREPVRIEEKRFHSLSLGMAHTCGLGRDGRAYCWGSNDHGQLGDGSRASRSTPVRIRTNEPLTSVVSGWNHSCALTSRGQALCWGQNAHGQLGVTSVRDRPIPSAVGGDLRFRSITAGSSHTCGVTSDGIVFCWGQDLGRSASDNASASSIPARVNTSRRFVEISAGGRHTCGLTRDGTAYCWGQNYYGQLGDGGGAHQAAPVRVQTDVKFSTIRSSGAHTCGTTSGSDHFCWGYNIEGQLGDGTQAHRTTPQQVQRIFSSSS